jgi:hypothetical protein
VSLLDVAPTLVRLAGCALPSTFRGRPLLGAAGGPVGDAPSRPIFAQHQARLAVVLDDLYYARDLMDLSGMVPDRNAAARLRPLPPRTARLDPAGAPPRYRTATGHRDGVPLEALIEEFVSSHEEVPYPEATLDEETRARLRAMGYLSEGESPPSRSR